MNMAHEEVKMEVEAVEAVYGGDCVVLDSYPPNFHLRIKPRTADVSSQQFVEAVIGIQASEKYPEEPPCIHIIDSKGLDERRKKHLTSSIQARACELSSCLMLVALCEEAVEQLSLMNHPDGDCPLCLYPLVPDDEQCETLPFMKLMSCFHCFHSECIIRWWNWLTTEEGSCKDSSIPAVRPPRNKGNQAEIMQTHEGKSMAKCPVCRLVFHAKDLEHVLDLVDTHPSHLSVEGSEGHVDEALQSESENKRRQRFEEIEKFQQEKSGLIEPRKDIVVLPGMYLPSPVTAPSSASVEEEKPQVDVAAGRTASGGASHNPGSSRHRNRKHRGGQNSRRQVGQRIRKDGSRDASQKS